MKKQNFESGREGERIAAEYLSKKGFSVIEKNFRSRFGEIDLICTDKKILVFIEVKLKVGEDYGAPEEMINKHKLNQVERIARLYLLKNPQMESKYPSQRIDAVAIVLNQDKSISRIDHYEALY